jgi:hypothetical protein
VSTTKATSLRSESLTTNHSSDTGLGFDWLTFIGVAGTAKAISGTTKDIMSAVDIVVAGTAAAAEEECIVAAATIAATKGIQEETAAAAAGAVNTKEEEVKKVVGATVEPSQSRGRPKKKQKNPPPQSTVPKAPAASCTAVLEEPDYMSDNSMDREPAVTGPQPSRVLPEALRFGVLQSINSSETEFGFELLSFISANHGDDYLPCTTWCKELVNLSLRGPKSVGQDGVYFPDCRRMELCKEYLLRCLSRPGLADQLIKVIYRPGLEVPGPSFWEDVLAQMTGAYYMLPEDESNTTNPALRRISQSLYAKLCCVEFFLALLKHQLAGSRAGASFRDKPIVADILRFGSKESLEKAVKAYTQLWMNHGHFVLANLNVENTQEVQSIQRHCKALFKCMGSICSYMAWLYLKTSKEGVADLSHRIGGIFVKESQEHVIDIAPLGVATTEELSKLDQKRKLNFLRYFKPCIVQNLRPVTQFKQSNITVTKPRTRGLALPGTERRMSNATGRKG